MTSVELHVGISIVSEAAAFRFDAEPSMSPSISAPQWPDRRQRFVLVSAERVVIGKLHQRAFDPAIDGIGVIEFNDRHFALTDV